MSTMREELLWLFLHLLLFAILLGFAVIAMFVVVQTGFLVVLLLAACIDGVGRCFGRRWRLAGAVFRFFLVSIPSISTGHWITRGRDGNLVHERYVHIGIPWPRFTMKDADGVQVYDGGRRLSWSRSRGFWFD